VGRQLTNVEDLKKLHAIYITNESIKKAAFLTNFQALFLVPSNNTYKSQPRHVTMDRE